MRYYPNYLLYLSFSVCLIFIFLHSCNKKESRITEIKNVDFRQIEGKNYDLNQHEQHDVDVYKSLFLGKTAYTILFLIIKF
jgi:hypothetical protein